MFNALEELQQNIEIHLDHIQKLLPDNYKITLLARTDECPDGDILLTIDDLGRVMAAIHRMKGRAPDVAPTVQ